MTEKIIHFIIANTAKSLAREAWEMMAKENAFYRLNKNPKIYVRRNWQHYIPFARDALVEILKKDYSFEISIGSYTPEAVDKMKADIHECLVIDGAYKAPAPQSPSLLVH